MAIALHHHKTEVAHPFRERSIRISDRKNSYHHFARKHGKRADTAWPDAPVDLISGPARRCQVVFKWFSCFFVRPILPPTPQLRTSTERSTLRERAKLAAQKTRKHLKTTWQRRAGPLNKVHWRVGHAVSARFRVLSSEIGGQEFFLSESDGSFWKGK